jgi:hypothetical protein
MKSILILIAIPLAVWAIPGEVIITGGASANLCAKVAEELTAVINRLDNGAIEEVRGYFTEVGFRTIVELLEKSPLENANPTPETKLLKLANGDYEVRDIKVKVAMGDTPGLPYQYLVFTIKPNGAIDDVRFSMERTHYQQIMEAGERLRDLPIREQLVNLIEIYRTAHNRKDLDYLKQIYSEDALIIVGRVVKPSPEKGNMFENSFLDKPKIEFIRKSKTEYLQDMEKAFQRNAFLNIVFDSIGVVRHQDYEKIYGVTLRQEWHSSTYSDTGWVFLLLDYRDEDKPIIYVRSWQAERFPDGSVLGAYDFKVLK